MELRFLIVFILFGTQCRAQLCDFLTELSKDAEITPKCLHQLQLVCNNGSLLWRMFDASSKYPFTGMSYSNNRDLGNYDQCVDTNYETLEGNVRGKHCPLSVAIVNIFLQPIPDPYKLEIEPKNLAQIDTINYTSTDLRSFQRALSDDYSLSVLSLCIPDQCTTREVGKFFIFGQLESVKLVNFVDSQPCATKDSNTSFEWGDIVFTAFLSFILFLVIWCTLYDFVIRKWQREPDHPVLLSFSLITNCQKLIHTSRSKSFDQIQCLNGIRFISMMWVIAGHGFVAMESVPLVNYADVRDYIDNPKAQYIGAAPIAVDTFFFLSGFLLTFGYLKSSNKISVPGQVMRIPMMIVHRYLRLTPALAVLYFSCITIFRMLGSGPLWGTVATTLSTQCTDHWWSFFLYIQNYVNYNDMCLNHSWYLSADMQMFILAPIVLIPVAELLKQKKVKEVIYGLLGLITICVIFPIVIRFADQTIDNVYDTHSRFNDYLIGVLLGVILRQPRYQRFPFKKLVNLSIWCAVLVICVSFNIYYHSIIRIYEHTSDTLFYGLYRPIWGFSLAWMVYSCHLGYGGPINWFLTLPAFQIGARLSYCMYLLHAVIQMYWVGLVRTPYYWGDYMIFYLWCGHFIVTMILSFVWSLCFESPMIVLEKFLFGGGGKRPKKEEPGRTQAQT